jgi:hypothetical protein
MTGNASQCIRFVQCRRVLRGDGRAEWPARRLRWPWPRSATGGVRNMGGNGKAGQVIRIPASCRAYLLWKACSDVATPGISVLTLSDSAGRDIIDRKNYVGKQPIDFQNYRIWWAGGANADGELDVLTHSWADDGPSGYETWVSTSTPALSRRQSHTCIGLSASRIESRRWQSRRVAFMSKPYRLLELAKKLRAAA